MSRQAPRGLLCAAAVIDFSRTAQSERDARLSAAVRTHRAVRIRIRFVISMLNGGGRAVRTESEVATRDAHGA